MDILQELNKAPPLRLAANSSQWPLFYLQQKIPLWPKKQFTHKPLFQRDDLWRFYIS